MKNWKMNPGAEGEIRDEEMDAVVGGLSGGGRMMSYVCSRCGRSSTVSARIGGYTDSCGRPLCESCAIAVRGNAVPRGGENGDR